MSVSKKPRKRIKPMHKRETNAVNTNPIAYLCAVDNIQSRVRTLKTQVWVRHVGEEAVECLAMLAWLIGLAAEVELQTNPDGHELRVLHGACRMIQAWCLSGYTWQIEDPAGMERCIDMSHKTLMQKPQWAIALAQGAHIFSHQVRTRTVTPESISGAEIYRKAA